MNLVAKKLVKVSSCILMMSLLVYFFLFVPQAIAASIDLNSFLSEVKANNPVLRAAHFRQVSARDRVKPAGTLDDPFFAMGLDQLPFSGQNMSVIRYQINQTLPFPGKLRTKMRTADALANMSAADTEILTRQTILMATYFFYKAYYLQESLRNNASQRAFVKSTAQSEQDRYKAGESVHHEWLLAMAELGILETEALRLKREKDVLDAILNQYRNKSIDTLVGSLIVRFVFVPMDQNVHDDALENQPEYKIYQAQLKALNSQSKLAKLSWAPDFMVQGMVMQSRDEMVEPSNWGVMMGLNVPLFGYRKQAKLVSAAKNDVQAAKADLQQITNKLATAKKSAQLESETAQNIVQLYRNAIIPQTELAFESALSAYQAKTFPLSSLLQIARVKQTQKLEYLAAQLDVALSKVKGRELLSELPFLKFAPTAPTLFGTGGMGQGMSIGMGSSATGMGQNGMTGPGAKPQKVGNQNDSGMNGGGM